MITPYTTVDLQIKIYIMKLPINRKIIPDSLYQYHSNIIQYHSLLYQDIFSQPIKQMIKLRRPDGKITKFNQKCDLRILH